MGDDRPNVYVEDGVVVYRASSVGNCLRSLVASRLGYEPMPHPDWLLEKFAEGNVNEPIIMDMVREAGWYVYVDPPEIGQLEVEMMVGSKVKIRGHLDGVGFKEGASPGDDHVIEAKAFGEAFWNKYEKEGISAFPYYSAQLAIYMTAMDMPALFVVGLKDDDGIVTKIRMDVIDTPPVTIGSVKAIVARAEKWAQQGELPPCSFKQYPCQFLYLHEDEEEEEYEEDLEMDLVASQYAQGRNVEATGAEMKKVAGEKLKKLLVERGVDGVKRPKFKVDLVKQERMKWDMKGIEKAMGADIEPFGVKVPTEYVRVTERKQDGS